MTEELKSSQEEILEIKETKPYTFRKLTSCDIFPMLKIVKKIGVNKFTSIFENEAVKNMINNRGKDNNTESNDDYLTLYGVLTFELVSIIVNGLSECEDEVFTLLGNVTTNMTKDAIKSLEMGEFASMIVDFVKKEEFVSFIKAVSKLIK